MDKEMLWLKFILTGKAEDYIKYTAASKAASESGGEDHSFLNGRIGDRSEQHRG